MGKRLAESLTTPLRKKPHSRLAVGEEWYSIVARRYRLTTHQLRCAIRDGLLRHRRATAARGARERGTIVVEEEVVANLDVIRHYSKKGSTPLPPKPPAVEIWARAIVIVPASFPPPKPQVVAEARRFSPEQPRSMAWGRAYRAWWSSPEHVDAKRDLRAARSRGAGVPARKRLRRRLMRTWLGSHPELDPRDP
jgi:hypothetical protein